MGVTLNGFQSEFSCSIWAISMKISSILKKEWEREKKIKREKKTFEFSLAHTVVLSSDTPAQFHIYPDTFKEKEISLDLSRYAW